MLWHPWIWFVYDVGSIWLVSWPAWRAISRELSALKLRRVEHVSWIINTPDFEDVSAVVILVPWCILDGNIYSRSRTPGAVPSLTYMTSFHINIGQFDQAGSVRLGTSGDAPELSRSHYTLTTWRLTLGGKGNHGLYPCVGGGSWCHRAWRRLSVGWCHWSPLPI